MLSMCEAIVDRARLEPTREHAGAALELGLEHRPDRVRSLVRLVHAIVTRPRWARARDEVGYVEIRREEDAWLG